MLSDAAVRMMDMSGRMVPWVRSSRGKVDMGCVGAGWERHPTQDQEWESSQLVSGV